MAFSLRHCSRTLLYQSTFASRISYSGAARLIPAVPRLIRQKTSCSSMPKQKDPDGFDAQADTVGAGIYGGKVKRDADGNVLTGRQYENHNPTDGPIYAGNGYTEMSTAIHKGPDAVRSLLAEHPELVNDVSTGGASPLHTCGMSRMGQMSTQILIEAGGVLDALDTYGYTPLHRMASNNLAVGAAALIAAGANPTATTIRPYQGDTPLATAQQSSAHDVVAVLKKAGVTH